MEALILIAGLFLLFWFKSSIKKSAQLLEKTVNVSNDTVSDSLDTYANEIFIMNAQKRSEQMDTINSLDTIVNNDQIKDMLAAMANTTKDA